MTTDVTFFVTVGTFEDAETAGSFGRMAAQASSGKVECAVECGDLLTVDDLKTQVSQLQELEVRMAGFLDKALWLLTDLRAVLCFEEDRDKPAGMGACDVGAQEWLAAIKADPGVSQAVGVVAEARGERARRAEGATVDLDLR